jgi:hypothetical protein
MDHVFISFIQSQFRGCNKLLPNGTKSSSLGQEIKLISAISIQFHESVVLDMAQVTPAKIYYYGVIKSLET